MDREIIIHPVGGPNPGRYDLVGILPNGKRVYLTYVCCKWHAELIIELIENSIAVPVFRLVASRLMGRIREQMNLNLIKTANVDCLINHALSQVD